MRWQSCNHGMHVLYWSLKLITWGLGCDVLLQKCTLHCWNHIQTLNYHLMENAGRETQNNNLQLIICLFLNFCYFSDSTLRYKYIRVKCRNDTPPPPTIFIFFDYNRFLLGNTVYTWFPKSWSDFVCNNDDQDSCHHVGWSYMKKWLDMGGEHALWEVFTLEVNDSRNV